MAVPKLHWWKEAQSSPLRGAWLLFRRKVGEKTSLQGRLFHISLTATDLTPQKHHQCWTNQICQSVFQETNGTINDYTARHREGDLGLLTVLACLAAHSGSIPEKAGPRTSCEPHLPWWRIWIPALLSPSDSLHASHAVVFLQAGRRMAHTFKKKIL